MTRTQVYLLIALALFIAGWWLAAGCFVIAAVVMRLARFTSNLPRPPQDW